MQPSPESPTTDAVIPFEAAPNDAEDLDLELSPKVAEILTLCEDKSLDYSECLALARYLVGSVAQDLGADMSDYIEESEEVDTEIIANFADAITRLDVAVQILSTVSVEYDEDEDLEDDGKLEDET